MCDISVGLLTLSLSLMLHFSVHQHPVTVSRSLDSFALKYSGQKVGRVFGISPEGTNKECKILAELHNAKALFCIIKLLLPILQIVCHYVK